MDTLTHELKTSELPAYSPEHYQANGLTVALRHDDEGTYTVTVSDDPGTDHRFEGEGAAEQAVSFINNVLFRKVFRTSLDTRTYLADKVGIRNVGAVIHRGDIVPTGGGAEGHFVGIDNAGVVWMAYQSERYQGKVERFDLNRAELRKREAEQAKADYLKAVAEREAFSKSCLASLRSKIHGSWRVPEHAIQAIEGAVKAYRRPHLGGIVVEGPRGGRHLVRVKRYSCTNKSGISNHNLCYGWIEAHRLARKAQA